jgi:hypothetical protein
MNPPIQVATEQIKACPMLAAHLQQVNLGVQQTVLAAQV